jgi:hypothetical protein
MTACYDFSVFNDYEVEIETFSPDYIIPLIKDSITLKQILEQSDSFDLIQENTDYSLSVLYRDSTEIGFWSDPEQFGIQDQPYNETLTISTIPTGIVPGTISYPFSSNDYNESFATTTESGGNVELTRIDFSEVTIQVQITNNFHHNIENGIITFKSLKNSTGNPLVMNFSLNDYGSVYNNSIQLNDNYFLDAYNTTEDLYNNFCFNVSGDLTTIAGNPVNTGDNISIRAVIQDVDFKKITGKINYTITGGDDSFNTDVFQSAKNVELHFSDPRLTMQFINSYGVPMVFNLTNLTFTDSIDQPVLITTTGTGNEDLKVGDPNYINYINGSQQNAITALKMDSNNSNIEEVFNSAPKSVNLSYDVDLGDNTSNHNYFVNKSSTLIMKSEIEIPMYGWAKVTLSDTVDFDLPEYGDEIEDASISLHLTVKNEIPLNIYFQAKFLDSNDQIVTTLFDGIAYYMLVESAEVNNNGLSTNAVKRITHVNITKEKYDLMVTATKMVIIYRMTTGGNDKQDVKVLSTNKLDVKANISIRGTINPN